MPTEVSEGREHQTETQLAGEKRTTLNENNTDPRIHDLPNWNNVAAGPDVVIKEEAVDPVCWCIHTWERCIEAEVQSCTRAVDSYYCCCRASDNTSNQTTNCRDNRKSGYEAEENPLVADITRLDDINNTIHVVNANAVH